MESREKSLRASGGLVTSNGTYTLHNFQSRHIAVLCLIMGYFEVMVCTLHECSATGCHTLQDISLGGIPDRSVWSPNYVNKTHLRSDTGKDMRPRVRQEFLPPKMDVLFVC